MFVVVGVWEKPRDDFDKIWFGRIDDALRSDRLGFVLSLRSSLAVVMESLLRGVLGNCLWVWGFMISFEDSG